jgi:hypothetical protein
MLGPETNPRRANSQAIRNPIGASSKPQRGVRRDLRLCTQSGVGTITADMAVPSYASARQVRTVLTTRTTTKIAIIGTAMA